MELIGISPAAFVAGLMDAIVGGGGLILLPALFAAFPGAPPPTLLGTNKCAAIWGTLISGLRFARRVQLRWAALLPGIVMALIGAFIGAWAATWLDAALMRKALPVVLTAVLLYTLIHKQLGTRHAPIDNPLRERFLTCAIGLGIGFYDGIFGPGTGSFFIFLLVRLLGYDFLHAAASAKLLNVATNFAALVLFALQGHVWWKIGLVMAAANIAGSLIGTSLALRHGARFVRLIFILVVTALIAKTASDVYF